MLRDMRTSMQYANLGRTGLKVSRLCLGTMNYGPEATEAEGFAQMDKALDLGINFFDTADVYGWKKGEGYTEQIVGNWFAKGGMRREKVILATKVYGDMNADPQDLTMARGLNAVKIRRACENSLKRLKTDYIDLYYLHMWDFRTPVDEVLRAFDDLVRTGKILYIGVSDTPAWQISRMQAIAEIRGWTQFCALQISYSLTERTVEREMIPMAAEMGMGVCPWSPLGGGVLAGKYSRADLSPSNPKELTSRKAINAMTGRLSEQSLAAAAVVGEIAKETGRTSAQVAVAWTLTNPVVVSPVLGVRTLAQLQDNLGSLEVELSKEQLARLDAVSRVPKVFPMDILKSPAEPMMFGNVKVRER